MEYDNRPEDLFADLNLHIRELANLIEVFKIALKCEYEQPEPEQIKDTLEVLSQKIEIIRDISDSIKIE